MRFSVFFLLIGFSNLSLAVDKICVDKTIINNVREHKVQGVYFEEATFKICYVVIDTSPRGHKYDSPILVFSVLSLDLDSTAKFKSQVRFVVSGSNPGECIRRRRNNFNENIDYYPYSSYCHPGNLRFNFKDNDQDTSLLPMLFIYKMDTSQIQSDRYIDLEIGNEKIFERLLYYTYQPEVENSCSIEVDGQIGGIFFSDEEEGDNKRLRLKTNIVEGSRIKLIHSTDNEELQGHLIGYSHLKYGRRNILRLDDNDTRILSIPGKNELRIAPVYDVRRSELLAGEYTSRLEILCE